MSCSIFNAINTIFCFLSITLTSTLLFKTISFTPNLNFVSVNFLYLWFTLCRKCFVFSSGFLAYTQYRYVRLKRISRLHSSFYQVYRFWQFDSLPRVLFLRRKPSIKEICLTWFIRLPVQHGISLLLKGVCFHTIWLRITG